MDDRHDRILLIDDDLMMQDLLSCVLEVGDYEVEVARDGASALEMLSDRALGIALTGRHLRGETGGDVLRRFLSIAPDGPRPAFVAVTGDVAGLHGDPADCALFDTILPKPVDIDRLLDALRGRDRPDVIRRHISPHVRNPVRPSMF